MLCVCVTHVVALLGCAAEGGPHHPPSPLMAFLRGAAVTAANALWPLLHASHTFHGLLRCALPQRRAAPLH